MARRPKATPKKPPDAARIPKFFRRPDDAIEAVCCAIQSAACAALCLYSKAHSPEDREASAKEEWRGCDDDPGLYAKWQTVSAMDTKAWEDTRHWQFTESVINIVAESRPDLGWRIAWPRIAARLRELRPEKDPIRMWLDLRERADVLRGTGPAVPTPTTPPLKAAPDSGDQPTVWYHGGQSYSTDGMSPVSTSNEQHNMLKAFLEGHEALLTRNLEKAGVGNPTLVAKGLAKKFGEAAVRRPNREKGAGYYIRVRTLDRGDDGR